MNYLISNRGVYDTSLNLLFNINNINKLPINYFGGCIFANRVYFNLIDNLCSIKLDFTDMKIEIKNIDKGTHDILINDNYLYIQETYYNRIKRYNISNDGIIDLSSKYICPIYSISYNPNMLINDMILKNTISKNNVDLSNNNYRHINSLCLIPDLKDYIICSSSFLRNGPIINNNPTNIKVNSTIDYININNWSFESFEVPIYAMHDIKFYNNYIYFLGSKSLHKFDPYNKIYLSEIYNYDVYLDDDYISRGLYFIDNYAYYFIMNINSRNNNLSNNQSFNKNLIRVKIDLNNNQLVEMIEYDNITTIFSCVKN